MSNFYLNAKLVKDFINQKISEIVPEKEEDDKLSTLRMVFLDAKHEAYTEIINYIDQEDYYQK